MTLSETTLRIADISITVFGSPDQLRPLNTGRYRNFQFFDDDPDIRITLQQLPMSYTDAIPHEGEMLFDSGTVWTLFGMDDSITVLLKSPLKEGLPYRLATFDKDLSNGKIRTLSGSDGASAEQGYDPLEFPLSEILTVCLLARSRGLMVHACGIISDGNGLLFPGNSTDGKTTIARIWKSSGATVLNDDRIILRPSVDGFRMYGTPWHGDLSDVSAEGTRLTSVNFLSHGLENRFEKAEGAAAVSMLLKRSFLPLWSREGMDFTLDFACALVDSIPFRRLSFIPDSSVVEYVRCRN